MILNAQECYEKVLIVNSNKIEDWRTLGNQMYLYFQIGISGLVMYCSVVLMMAQKDAVSQLMNLTALWTLNNFDNFTYLVFDMVVMKNVKHRSIL